MRVRDRGCNSPTCPVTATRQDRLGHFCALHVPGDQPDAGTLPGDPRDPHTGIGLHGFAIDAAPGTTASAGVIDDTARSQSDGPQKGKIEMTAVRADRGQPLGADEFAFTALKEGIRAYVQGAGEAWAQRIERERPVPPELWDELRERGYLRLAAPVEYGGQGIPLCRYLELLELFSMSHASLRMIVHVCNGIWRPIAAHATPSSASAS